MPLLTSNYTISSQRRWLYASVALLLAIAQLISQLHSLEHLDEHDGDTHSELSCNLCILTADIGSNAPSETFSLSTDFQTSVRFAHDSDHPLFFSPNYGFDARAPPVVLQVS